MRPEDYFAEMLKSDEQMNRIKEKLLANKQTIEKKEENRNRKEQRKYGKKIQEEKLKEKIEKKKQNIAAIAHWKKQSKGKEYDIDVLENNIKEMGGDSEAGLFDNFKKGQKGGRGGKGGKGGKIGKSHGSNKGIQKSGKTKQAPKKRPGKSKRKH